MSATREGRNFATLDGLRGAAAVLVVLYHDKSLIGLWRPESAYLAVDLFFILSGCVIDHAYADRLLNSLSAFQFLTTRLIRLWPLYLLGALLGAANLAVLMAYGLNDTAASFLTYCAITAVVLAPTPGAHIISPLNMAAWSLLFEWYVNIFYGAMVRALTKMAIICLIGVSFVVLATFARQKGGLDLGVKWASFAAGTTRVLFGFFLGVLINRLPRPTRRSTQWAALPVMIVPASLWLLPPSAIGDLLRAAMLLPALVWIGLWVEPVPRMQDVFRWAGRVSYPLYIIHVPIWTFIAPLVAAKIEGRGAKFVASFALLMALIVLSWLLDRYYDQPIRDRLNRLVTRREPRNDPVLSLS